MTDYEQLVKALRDIEKTMFALGTSPINMGDVSISLAYDKRWGQTAEAAAAAIEDLVKRVKCAEEKIKLYKGEADLYKDLYRSAHEAFMKELYGSHGTLANLQSLMQSPIPHNLCPNRAEEVYNLCANYPEKPDSSENPNS